MDCSEVLKLSQIVENQFLLLFESNEVQRKARIYFFQLITVALEISLSVFQCLVRFGFLGNHTSVGKDLMLVMVFLAYLERDFLD